MELTTGTPAYMAPETILGEKEVDRRADIYALGCVAYFLLTGQIVFDAETPMKILLRHLHDTPVPPSQRTEIAVPAELDRLILGCLEKDPADRPPDAEALSAMVRACRTREVWDRGRAQAWWERHLPELCKAPGWDA
jgi:serine/threonine-protein kinase